MVHRFDNQHRWFQVKLLTLSSQVLAHHQISFENETWSGAHNGFPEKSNRRLRRVQTQAGHSLQPLLAGHHCWSDANRSTLIRQNVTSIKVRSAGKRDGKVRSAVLVSDKQHR
jgi:hypothetical protein